MTAGDSTLADALKAEHAAIYGYGIVGAHVAAGHLAAVGAADGAHRSRRDALLTLLTARGVTPPGAETTYALPYPVTSDATALKLATTIEDRTAAFWLRVLPDTTGDDRKTALGALTDCATRGTQWRQLAGQAPATTAFPGR
jgi:hypothetical protein